MTSKTAFIAIALCCTFVILAATGNIGSLQAAVAFERPNSSQAQSIGFDLCWTLSEPCNLAANSAHDD